MNVLKILYAASEAVPFVKTGGLADVAGSLPAHLNSGGADVRVILPLYESIGEPWRSEMKFEFAAYIHLGWRQLYCGVFSLDYKGTVFYFIDNEYYFKRRGIYGHYDDAERFGFFCKAIIDVLPIMDWTPDLISCNDWQTALIPIYLRQEYSDFYNGIRTVFTIHNIEYQGRYGRDTLGYVFGLPDVLYTGGTLAYEEDINLMKGAIYACDAVTTVSPSYARELTSPLFSHGLHKVIEENSHKLRGILNGLDMDAYDPATDARIYHRYKAGDFKGKAVNKSMLQADFGLEAKPDVPLVACVSRLVRHKGFELVRDALHRLLERELQIIIMGTGDFDFECFFRDAAAQYPGRMSSVIMYADGISAKIYAAADMFLMPSLSEPCGLTQMISMRYGTVPIVREAGGLIDSIRPYPAPDSNGFRFLHGSAEDMLGAVDRALELYYNDRPGWQSLASRGMTEDLSWDKSAVEYMELYRGLIHN